MIEESMQLLRTLHEKTGRNDSDLGLIEALSSYIELQLREATRQLEQQLEEEETDDPNGITPTRR